MLTFGNLVMIFIPLGRNYELVRLKCELKIGTALLKMGIVQERRLPCTLKVMGPSHVPAHSPIFFLSGKYMLSGVDLSFLSLIVTLWVGKLFLSY